MSAPRVFISEDPPATELGGFYVSVIDGSRTGLLLGPFELHEQARSHVEEVRAYCVENVRDGRAWFYAYGTARVLNPSERRPGLLNERLSVIAP